MAKLVTFPHRTLINPLASHPGFGDPGVLNLGRIDGKQVLIHDDKVRVLARHQGAVFLKAAHQRGVFGVG